MGKLNPNWITGAHSGRACKHEDIYTKVDRKTGKCYAVKLCNPNPTNSEKQVAHRNTFGMINSAVAAWIKSESKASIPSAEYKGLLLKFKNQKTYSTLRGMIMAKKMAVVKDDQTVTITVGGKSWDVEVSGNITSNAPAAGGSGSTGSQNPPAGGGSDAGDEEVIQ